MEKIIINNQKEEKKSLKDYKNHLIDHLKSIYKTKYVFWKLLIFSIVAFIVFTTSFVIRDAIIESEDQNWILIPNFININIIGNTGIAFSGLSNADSSLVYFVQALPIIIAFIFLAFTKSYYIDTGLTLVLTGGMSNIIDRGIIDNYTHLTTITNVDAVVDYLQFSFIKDSAIFNMPDVFVILGVIIIALTLVIQLIIDLINEAKEKDEKEKNKNIASQNSNKPITNITNSSNSINTINKKVYRPKTDLKTENANKIKLALDKQQKNGLKNGKSKN